MIKMIWNQVAICCNFASLNKLKVKLIKKIKMKSVQFKMNLGFLIILFGMMSLFAGKTTATCQASFTWAQTNNNVINFTSTSTGITNGTFYSWTFGDGGTGGGNTPVYTYTVPGHYQVCLSIFDSLNNCSSSFCDSITVTGTVFCTMTASTYNQPASCGTCADGIVSCYNSGGTGPFHYLWSPGGATVNYVTGLLPGVYTVTITDANNCTATATANVDTCSLHASFTWSQPSNNVVNFVSTSTGINNFSSYFWDFGDGSYAYTTTPTHTYSNAGTYGVCLTVTDSSNTQTCSSTICDTVIVTGVNCNGLSISSTATNATCNTCADGIIHTTTTGGTTPYTYHWTPNITNQSQASGLLPGYYTCCVTDGMGCTACTSAYVDSTTFNNGCSATFQLYPDSMTAHLYWAVNNAWGVQPLHYTWSWGDASPNDTTPYPVHQYAQAGTYVICLTITDAIGCSNTYCQTDSLQRTNNAMVTVNVRIPWALGVPEKQSINNWSIYPNPVSNSMNINYNLSGATDVVINLYDMLGNKVQQIANSRQSAGQHSLVFDATSVPQGVYLMQIVADNKILNQKITVMK